MTLDEPSPSPAFGVQPTPPRPTIPDYELLKFVDRGSYGDVWLARSVTGLYRAVKIVWRARFPDPQPYEREFKGLKEFAAISLNESRQLALLHVGRTEEFFYYVMELADDAETGREIDPERYRPNTLKEVRERRGRLPAAEVVALGVELARGLGALHAHGLVHRDIKPSNVILVSGAPKLADIGLVATASAALTFVGTEGYVPPEGPGAPAADVFSLGKVLYELATGRDRRDYPSLPTELAQFSDRKELLELNAVIVRACEPDARNRFPDAAALRDELLLLQAGKSVRRLRAAERRTARALRVAAALSIVAATAGAGAWIEHARAAKAEAERDDIARKTVYSAGLVRAQRAIEASELGRARRLLKELQPRPGEPDMRGFEWGALWHEATGDAADVLREQGASVQRVHFSPDGKYIAGQSADLVTTVWDAATHQEVRKIPGVFNCAGFSHDGRWLVGVNRKVGIQRWGVTSGEPDAPAVDETIINRPLAALGENQLLSFTQAKGPAPHVLRIWDFSQQREAARMEIPPDPAGARWDFYRAAVAPNRNQCALALINGRAQNARWKLEIYDWGSGAVIYSESTPHRLSALAFSADGNHLAVAFGDTAQIAKLDVKQRAWEWTADGSIAQTDSLGFGPSDSVLFAGGRDTVLRIFDAASGRPVGGLLGHGSGITDIAWHPRAGLLSAGSFGDVRLWKDWSAHPSKELRGLWRPAGSGRRLCVASNGDYLAASDAPERGAVVVSTRNVAGDTRISGTWFPVYFDRGHVMGIRSNGRWECYEQSMPLHDICGIELFPQPFVASGVAGISDDGTILVAGGGIEEKQGELAFWDLANRRCLGRATAHKDAVWFAAVSPDGKFAVTGGGDQHPIVWRTDSARRLFQCAAPALCAAFTADSRVIALGLSDGQIQLIATDSGKPLRSLSTDSSRIQSMAVSISGKRLAAGGTRGAIHLFSTDDWQELVTLRAAVNESSMGDTTVSSVAFAANGSTLAAYLNDGRIRIWRTE